MRFDRRNLARRKKFSTTRWPSIVFGNPRLLPKDVHSTVQEYPTALSVDSDRYLDLHQNRGVAKFLYEIFSTYPVTVAAALLRPTGVRTSTRAQAQRTREASNDDEGSGGEGFQERRNGRRRRTPLSASKAFGERGSSDFV